MPGGFASTEHKNTVFPLVTNCQMMSMDIGNRSHIAWPLGVSLCLGDVASRCIVQYDQILEAEVIV